jgi:YD repeat-containing protein
MSRRLPIPLVCIVFLLAVSLAAQTGTVRYVYDELGRLVAVIASNGDAATYSYDAVGNVTSIVRTTSTQVSIIAFMPTGGAVGQTVTIHGTGFSATPGQNALSFNGTAATITSSTANTVTATVPSGATTGSLSITTPNGSANSSTNFVVQTATSPGITSISPLIGTAGTAVTITGTNFDTVAAQNALVLNQMRSNVTTAASTSLATVVPPSTGSGRFTVRTAAGTATSADDFFVPPPPLNASSVDATARLAFGQTTNLNIATAQKVGLIIFDGAWGQRVALKIVPGPTSSVTLFRPNQSAHIGSHPTGIGTTLMEPPLLSTAGTHQFLVDPNGSGTGTLALTLYDVPADVGGSILPDGQGVIVTTTVPGQNGRRTFTGAANDRISLSFSSGPLGTVSIRKPDNSVHASKSIGVLAGFIDATTLPVSGNYSVFVDFLHANTGSVTLTMYSVPADIDTTITPGGSGVGVTITAPGQNAVLSFPGTAAQRVSMFASSGGPTGDILLRRPDGTTQASIPKGIGAAFMEPQTLATTGTYSFKVDPENASTGATTITAYLVPADLTGTVSIGGAAVPLSFTAPGQNGELTFAGTASQQVTVRVTGNTMGTTRVRLLRPDGTQMTSSISAATNFNLTMQTLPTTGTYRITIDPQGTNTGSINISVTNP